jgi:cation:H+ antiporter
LVIYYNKTKYFEREMIENLVYVLFVAGFFALIKGADMLVKGASSLARSMGVSTFLIGLTVVSFGTTVPELVVNVSASLHGNSGIAIGNVIGSNITNILLILGLSSFLVPVLIKKSIVKSQMPIALLATLVVGLLANDILFMKSDSSVIDREDGAMLLTLFAMYIYYIFSLAKKGRGRGEVEESGRLKADGRWKSVAFVIAGIAGITVGGNWVVDGAVAIAKALGVSETLIGLTIIAVGTSVPELATAITAVYRKASSLTVGNIIGANILNMFWILGLSSLINPIDIGDVRNLDIVVMISSIVMLIGIMTWLAKDHRLTRIHGALFLAIYVTYILLSVT